MEKKFWAGFFVFWPILAIVLCVVASGSDYRWWFPPNPAGSNPIEVNQVIAPGGDYDYTAASPLGRQIDDLFYLILYIVTIVFIGVNVALGYVLFKGAAEPEDGGKSLFTHGSHNLEVIWTIVPAGILLFIALYQMDVWAQYRVIANFPEEARNAPIAEVTARQFEWRIRYPKPGTILQMDPQEGDLYSVNELHVPTGKPVMVYLRSQDVQHAFFLPELRVKQDAVPGLVIPVWFEASKAGEYTFLCAELCGWGHYKMKARLIAEPETEFDDYMRELRFDQNYDGVTQSADVAAVEE